MAITYTYERIDVASNGSLVITVFSLNDAFIGRQIIVEQKFNAGAAKGDIDSAISTTADLVWSLQT